MISRKQGLDVAIAVNPALHRIFARLFLELCS